MLNKRLFWVTLLCGCGLLAACAVTPTETPTRPQAPAGPDETTAPPESEPTGSYSVVDALGREVVFEQPPQRLVLVGRGLFMTADALYLFPDAPQRIAGLGQTAQGAGNFIALIDPDYDAKAVLEREAGPEQIAPLQPDAVILKSALAQTLGASIETLGIPVVYVDFETPEQYQRDLQVLGTLLQEEQRAAELSALYQERLDSVAAGLSGLEESARPRVLLLYAADEEGGVAFNVPPRGWIQTQMVGLAGGQPVWTDASLGEGWTTVSLEQIAAWDPDSIFVVAYTEDPSSVTAALKEDPNWQLLRAVQEKRLYAFAFDLYSWDQPDPRWILGLQWLATKLHPDRFADLDIVVEAGRFYEDFYGLDNAFFEEHIRPTFKGDLP